MKRPYLLLTAFLLIVTLSSVATAFGPQSPKDSYDFTPLNNQDILVMVERKLETEAIVKAIKSSPCTFDTFPPVLREMKRRGVPEAVLEAMVEAPYGPLALNDADELAQEPIYHYAEQLKQMGFLTPTAAARGSQSARRQSRTRASRRRS